MTSPVPAPLLAGLRIVAFIDILGFTEKLNLTVNRDGDDDERMIDELIAAYRSIRDIWNMDRPNELAGSSTTETKRVTVFSDSIVVSFNVDEPSEVFYTLLELKWLVMRMLSQGFLCRGAVSIGKFMHTDEYLFGPALVEAYLLESKAAQYPRITLDRDVKTDRI